MRTQLASETQRMCVRHPKARAVQIRRSTEKASAGEYVVFRAECDDCAKRNAKKAGALLKV